MFKLKCVLSASVLAFSFSAHSKIRCEDQVEWRGQQAEPADHVEPSIKQKYQPNLDNLLTATDDNGVKGIVLVSYDKKGEQDGPKFFMDKNGSLLEMNGDQMPNVNYGTDLPKKVSVLLEQPLLEAFVGLSAYSVDACNNYSDEISIVQNLKQNRAFERLRILSKLPHSPSVFEHFIRRPLSLKTEKFSMKRGDVSIRYNLNPRATRLSNVMQAVSSIVTQHLGLNAGRILLSADRLIGDLGADETDVNEIFEKVGQELNVSGIPTLVEDGKTAADITFRQLIIWADQ